MASVISSLTMTGAVTSMRDRLSAPRDELFAKSFTHDVFGSAPRFAITTTKSTIEQEERRNGGQPQAQRPISASCFHHADFLPSSVPPFLLFNPAVFSHRCFSHRSQSIHNSVSALSWR
jgi:hypothetical protein